MTLYAIKPKFQSLLRPLVGRLVDDGITANQVTVFTMLCSIFLGLLLMVLAHMDGVFLLLPVWLAIRMALNAIDGMMAREFDQESKLGAYLNEIGDMVADVFLYLPFAFVAPFHWALVLIVVIGAVLTELAGLRGLMIGASRRYDGPLGKSDRALVFGALGLWIGLGGAKPDWLAWLMPVLAILLAITVVNRLRRANAESFG